MTITRSRIPIALAALAALSISTAMAAGQQSAGSVGPDPREVPVPPIRTAMGTLPGVNELPVVREMPDIFVMRDGTKVKTRRQWLKRREEMKRILEYYAVGQMPPPPGNVKGKQIAEETILEGQVKYRLVQLNFGPGEKLSLNVGILTPAGGGRFPAIILQAGTPPGAPELPRLPNGRIRGAAKTC